MRNGTPLGRGIIAVGSGGSDVRSGGSPLHCTADRHRRWPAMIWRPTFWRLAEPEVMWRHLLEARGS